MAPRTTLFAAASVAALVALVAVGCTRDLDTLGVAEFPTDGVVFTDQFGSGIDYQAFLGSKVDALDLDRTERFKGSAALRITVPAPEDPAGSFAGGAFVAGVPRNLSGYEALTFWAKASTAATLNQVGFGNDNTGTSRFVAQGLNIQLSTTWTKYIIPIPLTEKLNRERGMFFFADGADDGDGYDVWLDDIQFETLGTIVNPRPAITARTVTVQVGATLNVEGTVVTFDVAGADQTVDASPGYFTFTSSAPTVATVNEDGLIEALGLGSATISAKLGSLDAAGTVTVNVVEAPQGPTVAAPTPTVPAGDVISLFSNAYTNVPVDTWSAGFDDADVADVQVAGDDVKLYTNLVFAGVEFTSPTVDATTMTHFHVDIWTPDATAGGEVFKIKLVDFGADGAFGGGDDSEQELTFNSGSTPPLVTDNWVSFDIPLTDFTGLTGTANLAQLIISGDPNTVYVDNVYFYRSGGGGGGAPTVAAPTPTQAAGDVISLFSNAYTDVTVDTWSAVWDVADVADVQVAGDDTKLYTNLTFAGVEFTSAPIDATTMTHFHMDMWTPDATASPAVFKIKLVDAGADGVIGTGGDDTEDELTFDAGSTPALQTGAWVSFDIPLTDFANMTGTGALAQLIISGDPNTVYVDNVYFYGSGGGGGGAPTVAAPTPTQAAGDVISLFSNAYTDVTVDTWSAVWDVADVADVQVAGDDTKLYTNLTFAGVEFTSAPIDATTMTHFHMDMWTPDATASPAVFKIKLVDAGADGVIGTGGDDTEDELTFDAGSTPALQTGAWVSFDIPLTDFANMTGTGALAQMIISGDPNTVYVDNVYFYGSGGGGGGGTGGDGATGGPYAVSFDDPGITYTLTDFGDASSALVPDPADAGNTVARTTKPVTAQTWAGTTVGGVNITYPFSATETQISVRVRSPDAGIPVRLKVETAGDPTRSVETEAVTTAANAWETLTFDFANEAPGTAALNLTYTYNMLSIFFNFGTDGATAGEKTYYWDTIEFLGGGGGGGGAPTVAAPTPTQAAGDVISLFSNAYTDVTVDTWSAVWDVADVADVQVAGDDTKLYTNLTFAGVEFTSAPIDATTMTHFHMDMWTPDATASPAVFKIKLVDAGADGVIGTGGDDTEDELTFDAGSTPALQTGAWVSFDIPLTDFANMTGTGALAQMIISGDPNTVYVDNVYFYGSGGGGGGGTGGDGATGGPYAVSFDDPGITYTLTDFGDASSALVPDPADAGNTVARTTKPVTAQTWAGTTVGGVNITYPFSATETQISVRVRSPDAGIPVRLKVETAGDPTRSVETEAVTTAANAWETLTFDFANEAPGTAALNLTYTYNMLSIFFNFGTDGATAGEKTYYWDTIEFLGGGGGGGGAPTVAAPTPTQAAGDVISLFSNAYTDVTVDTWSAVWDAADVADVQVAGDDTKLYTNLTFAGVEFTSAPIDATTMTHFHMDMWTPDATASPAVFKIKLVDAGADGVIGTGGDDTEDELTFDAGSTPALQTGAWVSFDIPLTDFANMTGTGALAQLIISGDPNTVYVDNVYFYR